MAGTNQSFVLELSGLRSFGEVESEIGKWLEQIKPEKIISVLMNDKVLMVFYNPGGKIGGRTVRVKVFCICHARDSLHDWLKEAPKITHHCLNRNYLVIFYETFEKIPEEGI